MRRKQLRPAQPVGVGPTRLARRLITGIVMAGLIAVGLNPLSASAAERPNQSTGKSVSASGSEENHPASNVVDGDQASYWEGPNNAFPQTLRIDLGESVAVDQVVLKLPTTWEARTQALSVQGSTDGNSYSTLSASQGRLFTPASANTVTIDFPSTGVRYVRLNITGNTGWPAAQISEFGIYGPAAGGPGDPDPGDDGTDLARGKAIEASSTIHSFVAANANDDRLNTYWESAGHPSNLTVKLGAEADITSVVVKLNPDAAWGTRTQNIQVLGRAQGATGFTSLKARADYSFNPATNQNSVRIPVTGRVADVQLQIFSNTGAQGGQVAELQVIGVPAPNPDLTVTALS